MKAPNHIPEMQPGHHIYDLRAVYHNGFGGIESTTVIDMQTTPYALPEDEPSVFAVYTTHCDDCSRLAEWIADCATFETAQLLYDALVARWDNGAVL